MAVYTCRVGGIRSDIDYYHLRKAFSQFDGMIGTKIIYNHAGRSTGYGFVNFSKETSMRDAIRIMNGMILYGHQMTVEEARSGGIRGGGGGGSGHGGRGGGHGGGRIYHGCSSGGGGRGYGGKDSRSVNGEGRGSNNGGRGRGGSGVAWNVQRQPLQQAPQVMGPIDFYSGPRVVNGFYIEYALEDEDANFFKFPSPAESIEGDVEGQNNQSIEGNVEGQNNQPGHRSWDIARLQQLFQLGDIAAITNVPIQEDSLDDRLYWQFSDDILHTVSSGYKAQLIRSKVEGSSSAGHIDRPLLSKLWKLKVP